MLERILIPLDGSAHAAGVLPYAVAIAKAMGSEVTLLHVIDQRALMEDIRGFPPAYVAKLREESTTTASDTSLGLTSCQLRGVLMDPSSILCRPTSGSL